MPILRLYLGLVLICFRGTFRNRQNTSCENSFEIVGCQTLVFLAKKSQVLAVARTRDSNETCHGDGNFKTLTIRDLFRLLLATVTMWHLTLSYHYLMTCFMEYAADIGEALLFDSPGSASIQPATQSAWRAGALLLQYIYRQHCAQRKSAGI